MKLNKDTLAQAKARSHGYCWPYRQWVYPESNNAFSFPIAFTSNWTLIPCSEAPGIGYYAFLEVVRNGMTGATINTYSGSGQILDHTIRAIAIGW